MRKVVEFLARVLHRRTEVEALFGRFVRDEMVVSASGRNVFQGQFLPLTGMTGTELYDAMLRLVFHSQHGGLLHACHRKGVGEIVLSCGASEPFALLNIGNSAAFMQTLEEARSTLFVVDAANDFEPSLFPDIDREDSPVSILIGSRKFTEGWSSWRVSAVGLLNMGVNEGTQIIQLFGRGVRLQGRDFSLRRTKRGDPARSKFVDKLETLEIFGLRANYMAKFREYLDEEGVTTRDAMLELDFPTRRRAIPSSVRVPQIAAGFEIDGPNGFRKNPVTLFEISAEDAKRVRDISFSYRDFAAVKVLEHRTERAGQSEQDMGAQAVKIDHRAYPFLDWDGIYRKLLVHKAEKGYRNLAITKARLRSFVESNDDWYKLFADPDRVESFDSFRKLPHIQKLVEALVCGYADRFYDRLRNLYESGHRELRPLTDAGKYFTPVAKTKKGANIGLKEGLTVEFKKSLIYSAVTGQPDSDQPFEIAKQIAAFMNAGGGDLYMGVDDNGFVTGIENDLPVLSDAPILMNAKTDKSWSYSPNIDGYKRKLANAVIFYLGEAAPSLMDAMQDIVDETSGLTYIKAHAFGMGEIGRPVKPMCDNEHSACYGLL